ncbi:MAG: dienelactone hydrolase family protein [Phycisphaerales bacterium]|nr:dienelactone hydrolase family protein [Phycisphaerales bacterium]
MHTRGFRRAVILGLVIAVATLAANRADAGINRRAMKIAFFTEKSNTAYAEKDWPTAIKYAKYVLQLAPYDTVTYYNLACCEALAGHTDAAFDALTRSIELGWDDPDHLNSDSDLESLRKDRRWAAMVKQAEACKGEMFVLKAADDVPTTPPAAPSPLIVVLHGFGGNAHAFAANWIGVMQAEHAVLVAPRGPTPAGNEARLAYAWSAPGMPQNLDFGGASAAVDAAIAAAREKYTIDDSKIVIAGFSQGASMALKLLARDPNKYAGAITMAASYDTADNASWTTDAKNKPRVALIVGENDRTVEDNTALRDALKQAGYPVELDEVPGAGHEVPPDHEKRLERALKFIFAQD